MRITAETLRRATPQERLEYISRMTEREILDSPYDWDFWARDDQLPPQGWGKDGVFIWFIQAGRGWGKTRTGAETFRRLIQSNGYRHTFLAGAKADDVRDIMIEGESGLLNVCPPNFKPVFKKATRSLEWPNGAITSIFYGTEPEDPRGKQSDLVWADEVAKWQYGQETFDNILMGLRLGKNPLCLVTSTPKPTDFIKSIITRKGADGRPSTIVTRGATYDNKENLSSVFINTIISKYEGTRLGRQELHGDILDDNPNALWKRTWLDTFRVDRLPLGIYRIVVAVDPAATSNADSDDTGIIVVAEGKAPDSLSNGGEVAFIDQPHYYVLDDSTLCASPNDWARAVVAAYYRNRAGRIVAESNNGGEMVSSVIRTIDPSVIVDLVWASKGKEIRAEPISLLTEQGRVHILGSLTLLEDELCEWIPGEKSPNRLDAMVWGVTHLAGESLGVSPGLMSALSGMRAWG